MNFCEIRCRTEGDLLLSSRIESEAFEAVESLIEILGGSEQSSALFKWKKKDSRVSAREAYAWRKAIDLIKESDIEKLPPLKTDPMILSMMKSRPIMLRVSGEIASALIHSHERGHLIYFSQSRSTPPT